MSWVLHHHPATSTPLPSLSLIHHVRVDASSITVGTRLVARTAAVARKTLAWPLAGPRRRHAGGGKTRRRSRRLRSSRRRRGHGPGRARTAVARKNAAPPPARHRRDSPSFSRRVGSEGFVPVAPGPYPAKAATAPVIGIIIEFLPTGPFHHTAGGDASVPRTHDGETQGLAQLGPVHGLHAHRL